MRGETIAYYFNRMRNNIPYLPDEPVKEARPVAVNSQQPLQGLHGLCRALGLEQAKGPAEKGPGVPDNVGSVGWLVGWLARLVGLVVWIEIQMGDFSQE